MRGTEPRAARVTLRQLMAVPEFRALFLADLLSLAGDWIARAAVTLLVYERTGSAAASALAFAVGVLPWALAGPLLSGLADRLPRRRTLVFCDLFRAGTVALAAVPFVPWPVLLVLIFLAQCAAPPFRAARSAIIPDILTGEQFLAGSALGNIAFQVSQVVGFALGGLLVVAISPHGALLVDAGTFALSALLLQRGLSPHPARPSEDARGVRSDLAAGARLVLRDPRTRGLAALAWLSALISLPEALAAPMGVALGGGALTTGLLLAANPLGAAVGSALIMRWSPEVRARAVVPLAALACAALLPVALAPSLGLVLVCFVVSGLGVAYLVPANQLFVLLLPADRRGQAFGLVVTGMITGQGAAYILGGLVAGQVGLFVVTSATGVLGLVVLAVLARTWLRGEGSPTLASERVGDAVPEPTDAVLTVD